MVPNLDILRAHLVHLTRYARVKLSADDVADLVSDAALVMCEYGASEAKAANRVWARHWRAMVRQSRRPRVLPLTIDVSSATCPRDAVGAR